MQADVPIAPLLFSEALNLCPNGSFLLAHFKEDLVKVDYQHISFLRIVKTNQRLLTQLQPFCAFSWIILEKNSKHVFLRYNSKYSKQTLPNVPTLYWFFNSEGCLLKTSTEPTNFVLSTHNFKYFNNTKPLWQIFQLDTCVPDPRNCFETCEFLERYGLHNGLKICYFFSNSNRALIESWPFSCNTEQEALRILQVFTLSNFSLGFQLLEKEEKKIKKTVPPAVTPLVPNLPFQDTKANRSNAISVKLGGLNLAYSLGLLTLNELQNWSNTCATQCSIALWIDYDDKFNARFVTIYSRCQIQLQKEIPPPREETSEGENEKHWQLIFNQLFAERELLMVQKKSIFAPLLNRLQHKCLETLSLYKNCFEQISAFVKNIKIAVYSTDDSALHALKFPFATYLKKKKGKKFKHLTLNVGFKNNLSTINTGEMIFFNMNMYVKEDIEQFMVPQLPKPLIKHSIRALKHGKQPDSTITLFQLCVARGKEFSPRVFQSYTRIVSFFMHYFQFDIALGPIVSLSLLSYQSIWTYYSKLAGPFHQGLEKTKTAYESLFRHHSHGGFSFSCRDKLEALKNNLHEKHTNVASTILELDIISSYGFAGSNIQMPKGFCNAFVYADNNSLTCVEPVARHNTFEFLAVYYTIFSLINSGVSVHTIFSNFHQNGLFSIKKYILDLAIITTQGILYLFQFDGDYVHGCRQGCPSLKSYVNGKSRSEVEKDTQKRDDCILEWVHKTNHLQTNSVFYFVITNCHDTLYSMTSLKTLFDAHPTLQHMIEGYPTQKTLTRDEIIFCNPHSTYIILLEGFIPLQYQRLLIHKNQAWQRTFATFSNEPLLLSKDYLDWLILKCNFQITIIHKVFFYKKCFVLNKIFKQLIEHRLNNDISACTKKLFKNIINYSVGFFGLNNNSKKQKTTQVKLIACLPRRYNIYEDDCCSYNKNISFFIKQKNKHRVKPPLFTFSQTPLPIFIMTIDYGKLRLAQILSFFDTYFDPLKYRHLYSNVDNIVLALSTETLLEAVVPSQLTKFQQESKHYFVENTPGHLKLEWIVFAHQEWKFVSPYCMTYVLLTKDDTQNQCKISSLNTLSVQTAYDYAVNILENKTVQVHQIRRVDKLLNKHVKNITFIYNKK